MGEVNSLFLEHTENQRCHVCSLQGCLPSENILDTASPVCDVLWCMSYLCA